jgi:hypothetical protein
VDTWYTNPPITDAINRYLWNVEEIVYTKEGSDGPEYQITTPVIIGTHGETGDSPYTLMLSNEFDTWVKSSAGNWISGDTITITASLYHGSVLQKMDVDKISAILPDNITLNNKQLNEDEQTVQLTLMRGKGYTGTDKASITFYYVDANCSLNKTFTIQTISSLVDYDLILPSRVIHTGRKPELI